MAISRYWRIVGIATSGNGALEISEARAYENGTLADVGATLSATFTPVSGALADLVDGSAAGVVAWPYSSYSLAGFALQWDFGSGGGVDVFGLRLGSGSSADTFLQDATLQRSSDGTNWTTYAYAVALQFPGPNTLTSVPGAGQDLNFYYSCALLLHGNGANNGTSFPDTSPWAATVTPSGNVKTSTAQSKFNGSSILFDGTSDVLSIPFHPRFLLPGDFTIKWWGLPTAAKAVLGGIRSGSAGYLFTCGVTAGTYICDWQQWDGAGTYTTCQATLSTSGMAFFTICSLNGTITCYINGFGGTSSTPNRVSNTLQPFQLGQDVAAPGAGYAGYLAEFELLNGKAEYSANFTPPTAPAVDFGSFPPENRSAKRLRLIAPTPQRMLPDPAYDLPPLNAHSHPREYVHVDIYNGGTGRVRGTTKSKGTSNAPAYCRVELKDEQSRVVIREQWSDPVTGAYDFRGIKMGVPYTTTAYDPTGAYRAVVANGQIPEAML